MGKTWTYEEDEILKSNYYELSPFFILIVSTIDIKSIVVELGK